MVTQAGYSISTTIEFLSDEYLMFTLQINNAYR